MEKFNGYATGLLQSNRSVRLYEQSLPGWHAPVNIAGGPEGPTESAATLQGLIHSLPQGLGYDMMDQVKYEARAPAPPPPPKHTNTHQAPAGLSRTRSCFEKLSCHAGKQAGPLVQHPACAPKYF